MNKTDQKRLAFMRENRDKILAQVGLTGHQAVHFLASCGMNDLGEAFIGTAK